MPSRSITSLMLFVVLVAACAGAARPVPTIGAFDQALVDRLVGEGWTEADAITIALTKLTVLSADEHTAHLVEAFPTGDTAEVTVTVTPSVVGDPALRVTGTEVAGGFEVTLAYQAASVADTGSVGLAAFHSRLPLVQPPNVTSENLDILITALFSKGAEEALDAYIEALERRLPGAAQNMGVLVRSLKSIGSVADALELHNKTAKLLQRIYAAGDCARNPTHPLTIQAYADDPGLRNRLLEQARDVRFSVKANTFAQFLALAAGEFVDLPETKWIWVGPVLGGLSAVATANFEADNEARVSALEASIVPCDMVGECVAASPDPNDATGGECAEPTASLAVPLDPTPSRAPVSSLPTRFTGSATSSFRFRYHEGWITTTHAHDVIWGKDPEDPYSFRILAGRLDWTLDWTWINEYGEQCSTTPTSGSESLVADEPEGLGDPYTDVVVFLGESNLLSLDLRENPGTYSASGSIGIHGVVRETCNGHLSGPGGLNLLIGEVGLGEWLFTGGDLTVLATGETLLLRGSSSDGDVEWSWDFSSSP